MSSRKKGKAGAGSQTSDGIVPRMLAATKHLLTRRSGCAAPCDYCDQKVSTGEFTLCIRVLHADTRSEGRIGRLYQGGAQAQDPAIGDEVEATGPDGPVRFRFLGWERPFPWSSSGWTVVLNREDCGPQ